VAKGIKAIKAEYKKAAKEYELHKEDDEAAIGQDGDAYEQKTYWDGYCRGLFKALELLGEKP
jgi:hypothetical protein